jgi:uncharacterized protein
MTDVRTQDAPTSTQDNSPRGDFIWYELMTSDAEGAKAFYDEVVGWSVGPAVAEFNGYRMIGRVDGGFAGGLLELTDDMKQNGARPGWLGYVYVPDVDSAVAAVEKSGGKTWMPPMDIPTVGRVALVTDPQAAPFYVMTPLPRADDPNAKSDAFSVDQPQHIRWNELSSDDQDGAIAFYTRHLGWTQEGAMPMGEMGDYRFIYANGVRIGAIMRKPPQRPVSAWTYYIGVDDIDRAAEAVRAGGGQILFGPIEIPGGEFSLNGMDPQGASFALVGPRK